MGVSRLFSRIPVLFLPQKSTTPPQAAKLDPQNDHSPRTYTTNHTNRVCCILFFVIGAGKSAWYHTKDTNFYFGSPDFTYSFFLFAESRTGDKERNEDNALLFVRFVVKFL
jgi:hypothetical protein